MDLSRRALEPACGRKLVITIIFREKTVFKKLNICYEIQIAVCLLKFKGRVPSKFKKLRQFHFDAGQGNKQYVQKDHL